MSELEYNAARRAKGLRAVAQGLKINLDLEVAIACLNQAADKIEELERELDEARNAMAHAQGELNLKTLDFERMREQRDKLSKQIAAERALADRLAEALRELCETLLADKPRDITELLNKAGDALAAWKEARSE